MTSGRAINDTAQIEQGPEFLVELLSDPPTWVLAVMGLVAIATVALSALSYHRHGIDRTVLTEVGQIGVIVFMITVCATLWVPRSSWSYAVDVIGSTLLGFALSQVVIYLAKEHATINA